MRIILLMIACVMFCRPGMADGQTQADDKMTKEALRIVTMGDSVTHGVRREVPVESTFTALLEKRLKETYPATQIINAGVGGHSTYHADMLVHDKIIKPQPAFVTIMYGINDSYVDEGKSEPRVTIADFEFRLRAFVNLFRYVGIEPILMTSNPMATVANASTRKPYKSHASGMNFLLQNYVEIVRKVAVEEKAPLIDVYARFWEIGKNTAGIDKLLTDGMHPNVEGHKIIADLLYDYFIKAVKNRAARPLPGRVIPQRRQEFLSAIQATKWETLVDYPCNVIPEKAQPAWGVRTPSVPPVVAITNETMRLSNVDPEAKRQIMTQYFKNIGNILRVTITAWSAPVADNPTTLSMRDSSRAMHFNIDSKTSGLTRIYQDKEADRISISQDTQKVHTYRFVMSLYDVAVFMDDNPAPVALEIGWLVPVPGSASYLQLSTTKGSDSFWKLIRLEGGKGE